MAIALVIGKFMPFHNGHKYLIDFARNYPGVSTVYVGCYTMPNEPIAGWRRARAIRSTYRDDDNVIVVHRDVPMPQEPKDDPDFWQKWRDLIFKDVPGEPLLVFASENYGKPLADVLGGTFIPVDINRHIIPVSGTDIRHSYGNMWQYIVPALRRLMFRTVTFYGSESVGKTTLTQHFARHYRGTFVPEYARGYLEAVGKDLTDEKLIAIANGQYAQDKSLLASPPSRWIFRDTDLLTTVGYTRMYGKNIQRDHYDNLAVNVLNTHSDLYLIPDTNIPFEQDPLRYGGDHRDSDTQYWVDLAEEACVKYHVLKSKTLNDRFEEGAEIIDNFFKDDR